MIPIRDNNPTTVKPVLTVSLIVLCVLVYLWQFSHDTRSAQGIIMRLGLIPAALFETDQQAMLYPLIDPWLTIFTSMFMHGSWMHLIFNMLYLWIFGNNIEDAMGHGRFVLFYLLCGIAAALAFAIPNAYSLTPMVGASGAISGVLGAYLVLYPRAQVLVIVPLGFIFPLFWLPAVVVLGLWIVIQVISSLLSSGDGAGVAWGAHIGGFIAGMALIVVFKHRNIPLFGGHK